MARAPRGQGKARVLEALARMLEQAHGERITTAELARTVGVTEAALYRHFPSKARMFESLIGFIEETIFARLNRILAEEPGAEGRLRAVLLFILGFSEKNPGMARLLHGDILMGETAELRGRIAKIHDRLEAQFRQILREGELREGIRVRAADTAGLLSTVVEGRIARFVRSGFTLSPAAGWEVQWAAIQALLSSESPYERLMAGATAGRDVTGALAPDPFAPNTPDTADPV